MQCSQGIVSCVYSWPSCYVLNLKYDLLKLFEWFQWFGLYSIRLLSVAQSVLGQYLHGYNGKSEITCDFENNVQTTTQDN